MSTSEIVWSTLLVSALLTYLGMFILGIPIILTLQKHGMKRLTSYAIAGFLAGVGFRCIGILVNWLWFAYQNNLGIGIAGKELSDAYLYEPSRLLLPGLVGVVVSIAFWIFSRPDLTPNIND
ncbi:hypothetical protein BJF95_09615 [Rhizobium oryziradicis]|uniref:Uncharacterized protein n=1 Tax=Rhizobium oryziradicis TaxID=1867956 RepID=A0A1Q8ZRP0_9HYPH|nr:hypothetical protein BJF95_09615 [Rhizobium oryziradicis]